MLRSAECEIITVYTNLKNICYGKIFPPNSSDRPNYTPMKLTQFNK
ncbi:MAG: hypothetical protein O4805_12515 [Trichodesmium sp. St16_bin2-tuft]|nr:hypothetical protein [Trichodesmium sp. St16_bin2-tuft]